MILNNKIIYTFVETKNITMSFQKFVTERLAAITASLNNIGTNSKRIFELPAQTTLDPTSLIHVSRDEVSESLEIQKIIDAINNGNYSQLLSVGEISVTGLVVSIPSGASWVYENINYATVSITNITETLCAAGFLRKDILVANQSNQIVLIKGAESETIRIRPNIPIGSVLVTELDVDDTVVGTPTIPIIGNIYVKVTENQTIDGEKSLLKRLRLFDVLGIAGWKDLISENGYLKVKDESGNYNFQVKKGNFIFGSLSNFLLNFTFPLTANRNLVFPDDSGTVALVKDIPISYINDLVSAPSQQEFQIPTGYTINSVFLNRTLLIESEYTFTSNILTIIETLETGTIISTR